MRLEDDQNDQHPAIQEGLWHEHQGEVGYHPLPEIREAVGAAQRQCRDGEIAGDDPDQARREAVHH